MSDTYISYNFTVAPKAPATEILIAQLANAGFDSFEETAVGLVGYITVQNEGKLDLDNIAVLQNADFDISYTTSVLPNINWNSEWEKNFTPVTILGKVLIRAPFHEKQNLDYDIVIDPKMSFGTGHHETTHLMIEHLLHLDLKEKRVLDMGCGTGVLAILSEMSGASSVDAIDIDSWCYENTLENVERNNCKTIHVYQGDATLLINKKYDVIIANINRNILLSNIETYTGCLNENSILLLSGFYQKDIPIIEAAASKNGLKLTETKEKNNWVAVKYTKKGHIL